jgi:hypothetical protein
MVGPTHQPCRPMVDSVAGLQMANQTWSHPYLIRISRPEPTRMADQIRGNADFPPGILYGSDGAPYFRPRPTAVHQYADIDRVAGRTRGSHHPFTLWDRPVRRGLRDRSTRPASLPTRLGHFQPQADRAHPMPTSPSRYQLLPPSCLTSSAVRGLQTVTLNVDCSASSLGPPGPGPYAR